MCRPPLLVEAKFGERPLPLVEVSDDGAIGFAVPDAAYQKERAGKYRLAVVQRA